MGTHSIIIGTYNLLKRWEWIVYHSKSSQLPFIDLLTIKLNLVAYVSECVKSVIGSAVISFCPAQNVPEWAHKYSIKILNQISTHAHFEVYNLRPFSAYTPYRTQCTQTLVHSAFSTPKKRQFQNLWSVHNGDTLDWMCL